jgi:hypothetical protein
VSTWLGGRSGARAGCIGDVGEGAHEEDEDGLAIPHARTLVSTPKHNDHLCCGHRHMDFVDLDLLGIHFFRFY